jgi:hypothetical protein
LIERVGDCGYRFQVELIYTQKLIVDQQSVKHQAQPSTTKISIEIDEKTTQKARKILEEIGRDERIDNAVKAVDVMEYFFKKYHLDQLLKLDVFFGLCWSGLNEKTRYWRV